MSTTVKTCFRCGAAKPLADFYTHPKMKDGRLNKCKECTKKDVSSNYTKNIDHYVAYEKQRFKSPERKKNIRIYVSARSPIKRKANNKTTNAIRSGKLIRLPCEICGYEKSEAHHDDYTKPLDVRWLCRKHHLEHHGKVLRSFLE